MRFQTLRKGHWPSLFAAWLHFEVSFMVWLLIGALSIAIAQEFNLNATQKGVLVSIPLLGGALLRVVVGPLADWFGIKRIGMSILGLEFIALLLGWFFGDSYLHMLGIGFLLGFAGASFAIALPIASQAYPLEHQGFAMGVAAVGNSGVLLATYFAPRLAAMVGWHAVFGVMIVPVVTTALIFHRLVEDRTGIGRDQRLLRSTRSVKQIIWQPFMYWFCFLYAVTFGGFVGLSSFLPIFFHDQYDLNMITAGTLTAICGLAGSIARPLGGHLADRLGGLRLLMIVLPIIAGLSFVLSNLLSPTWTFPIIVITVLILGFGNGVVFQVVSLHFYGVMGTASGFVGAAGCLGGFLLPFSFGVLKEITGTYAGGFLVLCFLAGVAAISVVFVKRFSEFSFKDPTSFT